MFELREIQELPVTGTSFPLPQAYRNKPLRVLSCSTRRKLAQFLDLEGSLVITIQDGQEIDVVNDFSGLAELAGFDFLTISNMKRHESPTAKFLEQWQGPTSTVGILWDFLLLLERYDVIEDCQGNILHDCQLFTQCAKIEQHPTQVFNSTEDEPEVLSVEDVRSRKKTLYHAFVSYTDEDQDDCAFVKTLIRELEVKRGLSLFVPGRNDLPGPAKHSVDAYLIEKRCRRVLILLSDSYTKSDACRFQMKFTHALSPDARERKLIPIIRDKCLRIPNILQFIALLDFSQTDKLDWIWNRLHVALYSAVDKQNKVDYDFSEIDNSLKDVAIPLWRPLSVSESESDADSSTETSGSSATDRKQLADEYASADDSITFLKRLYSVPIKNQLIDSDDNHAHYNKSATETDTNGDVGKGCCMQTIGLEDSAKDHTTNDVHSSKNVLNDSNHLDLARLCFSRIGEDSDTGIEGSAEHVVLYTRQTEPTKQRNSPV